MTSFKTKDSRFRNAPDVRETCQSVNPGHKPKHGDIRRSCFNEFIECDSGWPGAQSRDETIGCPETRRPLPGTIQRPELLLHENGFSGHGTIPAPTQESRQRNDDMDAKDDQIAHLRTVGRTGNARDWSENWQLARNGAQK
jgi:hypothetical protein